MIIVGALVALTLPFVEGASASADPVTAPADSL